MWGMISPELRELMYILKAFWFHIDFFFISQMNACSIWDYKVEVMRTQPLPLHFQKPELLNSSLKTEMINFTLSEISFSVQVKSRTNVNHIHIYFPTMILSEDRVEGLLQHKENFQSVININQEFKSGWLPSEPIKHCRAQACWQSLRSWRGASLTSKCKG